ncbi:unnamed protein product [Closterium sp. NIES-53]
MASHLLAIAVSARHVPPRSEVVEAFGDWDSSLEDCFEQLFSSGTWEYDPGRSRLARLQLHFPVRLGGFGIRATASLSPLSYACRWAQAAHDIAQLGARLRLLAMEELQSARRLARDDATLAHFTSLHGPRAGAWVSAVPAHADFTFTAAEWGIAAAVSLGLPIQQLCVAGLCMCGTARAPPCPAAREPHRPALQPSASRLAALPRASRSAAARTSHPAALHSARPAALSTARLAQQPVARPALPSCAAQAEPRRPARAAAPNPSCAALPHSPAPPSRPAATTAAAAAHATSAAGGGAAGSAGGAAGAGGAGGAAGAGGAGGAAGNGGGAAGAGGARPATDRSPRGGGFGFMGTAQRRQQCPQSTFSLQQPRDCDSQQCVPGCVEAAALGYSESAASPGARESAAALGACESANALGASASTATGPTSAKALHTFTLDSGASRCFFRDCTIVTLLAAPVPVSLADPSGAPVVARASTVLPCPAIPSGSLLGLHLPACTTNLLRNAVLRDGWVDTFIPGGQRMAICKCSPTGHHLATFTRQPGSGLYTLTIASAQVVESGQVVASSRVSASGQLATSCSCRVLPHQNPFWHHRLGHPSVPRLRSMHSRLLVSDFPRSLPSLPRSPAPPCLPCVEGRQRAAPHSSEFPPTIAPLQALHMDVWGPAPVGGTDQERYFLLVVDGYTRYTTVFPLRRKADVSVVLIPWIHATRRQLRERFRRDLPFMRLHSVRSGQFSCGLLDEFCRDDGICKTFTLPASPQQNGIA